MPQWTDRQKEIIESSIKIIALQGIQDFTTKNLAKAMNFSEAAIYKHFPGKMEIILAILELFEEQADTFLKKIQGVENPGFPEIYQLFAERCALFEKNPYYANVIFSEEIFQNTPQFKAKILSIMGKHRKLVLEILQNLKGKGLVPSHYSEQELTTIIMGSFRLMITQWRLSIYDFNLQARWKSLFDTLASLLTGQ